MTLLVALATGNSWAVEDSLRGGFLVGGGFALDTGNFADELEDALGGGFNVEDDGASTGPDLYLGVCF
ncbi:hypothetical protein A3754_25775 [Alcanivorax sp. HI0083]|uniref:hypothetical protein n=1 Tax=unclassified Alcanivorax TaxID=2638842 RepID=UPI0007B9A4C7|nr:MULTISPECIES: hypothetical protein [unclassified Alcanivorax]KZZ27621.1 hypothetical protein A3754_25775 [Alcanivorax sp. HI0083]